MDGANDLGGSTWPRRLVLGLAVRVLAVVVPIAVSVLTAVVVSRSIPAPVSTTGEVVWWGVVLLTSTTALYLTEVVARRLLPLAALLRLSLAFPDRVPSRFGVALRAGSPRRLRLQLARLRAEGVELDRAAALELVLTLTAALHVHDRRTRGHSERVRALADLMAVELRLSDEDRTKLQWASLVHDVGKLLVPAEVLNKPGKLTADEWALLLEHPEEGERLCEALRPWLGPWFGAIGEHHERWDGGGYPRRLQGDQISLAGRLVAVVDSYEVMTAARSYKRPMSSSAARAELARCAGSHFDPTMVRVFLGLSIGHVRAAMGPLSWLCQVPFVGWSPAGTGVAAPAAVPGLATVATATAITVSAVVTGVVPVPSTAKRVVAAEVAGTQETAAPAVPVATGGSIVAGGADVAGERSWAEVEAVAVAVPTVPAGGSGDGTPADDTDESADTDVPVLPSPGSDPSGDRTASAPPAGASTASATTAAPLTSATPPGPALPSRPAAPVVPGTAAAGTAPATTVAGPTPSATAPSATAPAATTTAPLTTPGTTAVAAPAPPVTTAPPTLASPVAVATTVVLAPPPTPAPTTSAPGPAAPATAAPAGTTSGANAPIVLGPRPVTPPSATLAVVPLVDCVSFGPVAASGAGPSWMEVRFASDNPNAVPVAIPVGAANRVRPAVGSRPTAVFLPGRQVAMTVRAIGVSEVVWTLGELEARATADSPACS